MPAVALGRLSYMRLLVAISKNGSVFCKPVSFNPGANGKTVMATLHEIYEGSPHLSHGLIKRITEAALMQSDAVMIAKITLVFANVTP